MSQDDQVLARKQSILTAYPNVISYDCSQIIMKQMEEYICKIKVGQEQGTGFFCKIPFPDKNNMLPVFITNNHVINEQLLNTKDAKITIDIKNEKKSKDIYLNNRMNYTDVKEDITIFEIKKNDQIRKYLELDENIIKGILSEENNNKDYKDVTIYIIQYPEGELSVSYGILDNISLDENYNFRHKCSTRGGSSGSPILNLKNKLIGIHKEGVENKYNQGTFLNYPIQKFIQKYLSSNIINMNQNNNINNSTNISSNISANSYIINNNDYNISLNNNFFPNNNQQHQNINYNNLNENLLKEYNQKYETKIEDVKVKEINLMQQFATNDQLKNLCKIEFKELKELNLKENNISDIKPLETAKFYKLEILDLSKNNISDINSFEKVNFIELKKLYLFDNKISDINVLEKVKFMKLEVLDLNKNKISDINVFKNVNFKELKKLYLNTNSIFDIKVFEKVKFNKLEKLSLFNNEIDKEKNKDLIWKLENKIKDLYI